MSPKRPDNERGRLIDVRVHRIDFHVNDEFDFDAPLNYAVETNSTVRLEDDLNRGRIFYQAGIVWRPQEEEEGEPVLGPFDLDLTLEAFYELRSIEAEHDELAAWIEFNSEHLLWPYLRAQIAGLTTAAGLPPLTIYTISVPVFDREPDEPQMPTALPESARELPAG